MTVNRDDDDDDDDIMMNIERYIINITIFLPQLYIEKEDIAARYDIYY